MAARVEISELVRMIRECAPSAVLRVTTHSIVVKHGEAVETFSKGKGSPTRPEEARGEEYARVARKVARSLGISPVCVNRYFPDLLDESTADATGRQGDRRR